MGPNVQQYNFTHQWEDLCKMDTCKEIKEPKAQKPGTILSFLESKPEFSKMREIILRAKQDDDSFNRTSFATSNKRTLFITDNKNIPDAFMEGLDLDRARNFIRAYTLKGTTTIQYLMENGSSIYTPLNPEKPMLVVARGDTLTVNKVGRVMTEMSGSNGHIIVMDNIAMV